MTKQQRPFYSPIESVDEEGEYRDVNSHEYREEVRADLKASGAPDTELIEFISIEHEDRTDAIVEALITDALWQWLRLDELALEEDEEA